MDGTLQRIIFVRLVKFIIEMNTHVLTTVHLNVRAIDVYQCVR